MERESERTKCMPARLVADNDQALWDAYVKESLKAAAECEQLWKERMHRERRHGAGSSSPDVPELTDDLGLPLGLADHVESMAESFSSNMTTSTELQGRRMRLRRRLCGVFQGCLSQLPLVRSAH